MRNKEFHKLKRAIFEFENSIFSNAVIQKYPLAPAQFISILANYKSKVFKIHFNSFLDIEKLEGIITQVIRNNDLLRSSIISEKGKLLLQEYELVNTLKLPILDFSNKSKEERDVIINKILTNKSIKSLGTHHFFIKFLAIRHLFQTLKNIYKKRNYLKIIHLLLSIPIFNDHQTKHKSAFCKFFLVKINIKEYILIIYWDHFATDNLSIGLLINQIEQAYKAQTYNFIQTLPYSNYSAQLQHGPKITDAKTIINRLQLEEFYKASGQMQNQDKEYHYSFQYRTNIKEKYQKELVEISILISAIICSKAFQMKTIPFTLLMGNRKYHLSNYFNTIGLFQDFVPFLLNVDSVNHTNVKSYITDYLNFFSENNIHILYLIFNKSDDPEWHHLLNLVNPMKLITSEPVLTLNLEFDYEKKGYLLNESLDNEKPALNKINIYKSKNEGSIKNLRKKGGVIFWVEIGKENINFVLESLYPFDGRYFETLTTEIEEFIN